MSGARDRAARTIDATFREHGVAATYLPPAGTPVGCTIIMSDEDRTVQFPGVSRPIAEGGRFEVRASEIATPLRGSIFALLDDDGHELSRHAIIGDPLTDDPYRMVWICTVRP